MNTNMKRLALCALAVVVVAGSTPEAHAGIIPWTYNAIFGPVGSTFGQRRAYYAPAYGYQYQGVQPAFSGYSGIGTCNTCNYGTDYTVGYVPYYSSYQYGGCASCVNGCASCSTGCGNNCPTGNCTSSYQPASGITPTPDNTVSPTPVTPSAPTPTQTFRSNSPTVNPDAGKSTPSTFERNDGFQQPTRPQETEPKDSAPPFTPSPFSATPTESRKVPNEPLVPVEQRQPAPSGLDGNGSGSSIYPELRVEPAPVALETADLNWNRTVKISRSERKAQYMIPTVARHTPANNPLLPPLPAPVQLVGK